MISPEDSIPSKSEIFLENQDLFYTQFNIINFYVEDEAKENFYRIILKKLFPSVSFEDVFPLKGKHALLKHIRNFNSHNHIYILDKDLDDILIETDNFSNLFYLEKFCIENYLLEHNAILELLVQEKPTLSRELILSKYCINNKLAMYNFYIKTIFELFYIVRKFSIPMPNTGISIYSFTNNDKYTISERLVDEYVEKIKEAAIIKGLNINWSQEISEAHGILNCGNTISKHVSGKYILNMMRFEIKAIFKTPLVDNDSLNYRLAEKSSFVDLYPLRDLIWDYLITIGFNPRFTIA